MAGSRAARNNRSAVRRAIKAADMPDVTEVVNSRRLKRKTSARIDGVVPSWLRCHYQTRVANATLIPIWSSVRSGMSPRQTHTLQSA